MDVRETTQLTIRVVSDVICPWCFIGKRRLEKALARLDHSMATQIVWAPFELNPGMPAAGMERKAYRSAKFGNWERSLELDAQVAAVGKAEGIEFNFSRIERTPNTFAAHRLIWFAQQHGRQEAVVEELFRRYFSEGEDIGKRDNLLTIAVHCGIPPSAAEEFLESDEGAAEVARESRRARAAGISAVPTFILNNTSAVSGAQTPEALLSAFYRGQTESKPRALL